MHYKKEGKVLIIRTILTKNMYHDHNYLTNQIHFDCERIDWIVSRELMNTAQPGDWGVRRVQGKLSGVWRIWQHSVVRPHQFSRVRHVFSLSPAD